MRNDFPAKRRNRFLDRFCCVGGRIIVKHNHFMLSLVIFWSFFTQSLMQINLLSVTLGINRETSFNRDTKEINNIEDRKN